MAKKRRRGHTRDKRLKKRARTRNKTKDLDEIDEDLNPKNAEKLMNQEVDLEKPGNAQFYCLHCARYFIDNNAMEGHFKTKGHKRRMKALELEPYSIEESLRAAGMGNYVAPKKRLIETQPRKKPEDVVEDEEGDVQMSAKS